MTRQTWSAVVAASAFIALSVVLSVAPVPYVTWSPGGTRDTLGAIDSRPIVSVEGIQTHPTSGSLDLTVVSVTAADSTLTLPQAVAAYFLPDRDVLPRVAVYSSGKSAEEVEREEADMMETAQDDAVVAALRAAGEPVSEMPVVAAVTIGGPAQGRLLPGDLVVSVDGQPTAVATDVQDLVEARRIGDQVTFVVLRDRVRTSVPVATGSSTERAGTPAVGIQLSTGYRYAPRIAFDFGQQIGGPSAGLVFALAIYDKVTPGPLLGGRHVAGTGGINPRGEVSAIGGIHQKIAGAEAAGATHFLVPAANCGDLEGVRTELSLIRVNTLGEAIVALQSMDASGDPAATPRC